MSTRRVTGTVYDLDGEPHKVELDVPVELLGDPLRHCSLGVSGNPGVGTEPGRYDD